MICINNAVHFYKQNLKYFFDTSLEITSVACLIKFTGNLSVLESCYRGTGLYLSTKFTCYVISTTGPFLDLESKNQKKLIEYASVLTPILFQLFFSNSDQSSIKDCLNAGLVPVLCPKIKNIFSENASEKFNERHVIKDTEENEHRVEYHVIESYEEDD